ncbi:TPA: flippase [Streptococcus suis]
MKIKSIKVNATLNVIKQIFTILFPMITVYYATRILGKENYGNVNYVKSITSYFTLFAGLGVSTYAVREGGYLRENKQKYSKFASEIYTLNILSTFTSFVLLLVFSYLYKNNIAGWNELILIFSLTMLLTTIGADWVNTTFEDFLYITIRYIFFYFISFVALFLFVRGEEDYLVYACIIVLSSVGGNILNIFYIRRYVKLKLVPLRLTVKHLKRILILFSSNIAATIYINSDTTMIGAISGPKEVAVYTVASNIYIAVKQISNSAITVVMPRMSHLISNSLLEEHKVLVNKIISYVFVLLIPASIGVYFLSNHLMNFMGGLEYSEGANALRILSLTLVIASINYVISRSVTLPYKEDKLYFISTAVSAIVNICLNFVLLPIFSYTGAALTTLISEIIVFIFLYNNSKRYINLEFITMDSIKVILSSLLVSIVCFWTTNYLIIDRIYLIFISIILSFFVYIIALILLKHSIIEDVKAMLILRKRKKRKLV